MYYGDKRESKVNICHTLQQLEWTIYGYHADQSDSMTDYYCPAYWDGIATKNGFTLCIDVNYHLGYSGKVVERYTMPNINFKNNAKIEQLKVLANNSGATEGEKTAALEAIKRLEQRVKEASEKAEKTKEVVYTFPTFQANPPHCNWHIEKDNVIIAKGNGAFSFHNLPYWVDHMTGNTKDIYRFDTSLNDEQKKDLKKFQAFINKLENIVSVKIGDGEAQPTYKTITVTEYKKENKAQEVSGEIQQGSNFILKTYFNYGCSKGLIYHIESIENGYIKAYKWNGKLDKLCKGRASRNNTFNVSIERLKKWIDTDAISLVDIIEVKTPYQVEKCVKVESGKSTSKKADTQEKEEQQNNNTSYTYTVNEDIDTRDNSKIYVVKINEKLSREEYIEVAKQFKTINGYYSKFKHGFIFKDEPTEKINALFNSEQSIEVNAEQTCKKQTEQQEQNTANQKTKNKESLQEKINKQIDSIQKKIDALSGDYKCNTYKRMREQESREQKINGFKIDIELMQYLLDTLEQRELNLLELALINGAFRDEIHSYYLRHEAYKKSDRVTTLKEISYPQIMPEFNSTHWYNKEVPTKQNRLKKAGIKNTKDLIEAVKEYAKIFDTVHCYKPPIELKIKKLEREARIQQKGDINFTPSKVAKKLVELARINENSRVLEPSAGIGAIADEIKNTTKNIDVVERMCSFRELLQLKGYNLVGDDFLEYETDNKYDAIVMNPPFSDEQNHIKHAFELLKDGGTLVSITSPHWTFASDRNSVNFKSWIESENSYTIDLPSGTFERTGVASKILVIEKQEQVNQASA